jgi:hypothetical protein
LSFHDDNERRRKSDTSSTSEGDTGPRKAKKKPNPEVGHALRAAYRQAIEEDIPPEMLDLLGKLG